MSDPSPEARQEIAAMNSQTYAMSDEDRRRWFAEHPVSDFVSDSGVRADPPGNAIDAAATAILSELPMLSGWSEEARQRFAETLAVVALAAAAPVIAAQAARDAEHRITQLENALHAYAPYHDLLKEQETSNDPR